MTEAGIRALCDRAFEAYNAQDWPALFAMMAPDARFDVGPNVPVTGPDGASFIIDFYGKHYETTFADWHHFIDGDRTASEATMRVTYVATEPGLPEAKGQSGEIPAALFGQVRGGKFTRIKMICSFCDWMKVIG